MSTTIAISHNSYDEFGLQPSELKVLYDDANHGNGDAAYRIAKYYIFVKNDRKMSTFWLKRASDLGSEHAKVSLSVYQEVNSTNQP